VETDQCRSRSSIEAGSIEDNSTHKRFAASGPKAAFLK
jgi:hypothetical protein